ncbi:helix-turn-helix transcriptional regulator [Nocardioides sp.]|uniref:helix-turn-helix domain-containing protein n=1 Tax=Nocardioides sp. TaxID=35761 RepID=UPI0026204B00|nr:helix-turn-helix transcriptional regulator [Nocardioides sp.]
MDGDLALQLKVIDPTDLGARIKRFRQQRGMTQGQLAGGVSSTAYVSRIEAGLRRPEPAILEGLARNLDIPVRDLLTGDATPSRARAQLELDYAELELNTGSAAQAVLRLDNLPEHLDTDHRQLADLLQALAGQALGADPIVKLEKLVAENPVNVTTWFRAQMALCRALRDTGELDSAAAAGEQALKHVEELNLTGTDDGIQLAVTLAGIYEMRGEIPRALRLAESTLAQADETSTPRSRAYVYWNASVCESEQGNISAAIDYAGKAISLLGTDGDARQRAMLLANIGRFHLLSEPPNVTTALATLATASRELETSGASATEIATATVEQARGLVMTGDLSTAHELVESILAKRDELGAYLVADALVLRGEILLPRDKDAATSAYHEAVLALAAGGQDRAVAKLWYQIAARFEAAGETSAALDAYRRAGVASGVVTAGVAAVTTLA